MATIHQAEFVRQDAPSIAPITGWRARYAIGLLLLITIFNVVDRLVLSIVAEPIKHEFHLLDWQIGMMAGTAFAIFYALVGLPIARLAERGDRVRIIGIALAVWSAFTVLSGFAQSVGQLVLARVGVGVGEAGSGPTGHSLVSDYVPLERRASALAIVSMGGPLGGLVGYIAGAAIADAYGWRMAFIVCGAPGLLLSIAVFLTLHEPRRGRAPVAGPRKTMRATVAVLRDKPTYWLVTAAAVGKSFIGLGITPFMASFYLRNHTAQIADLAAGFGLKPLSFLGLALGLMTGVAGAAGSLAGGLVGDRLARRGLPSMIGLPAITTLLTIPLMFVVLFSPSALVSLFAMSAYWFMAMVWYGPAYATIQGVAPPDMRATAASLMMLFTNLFGLGLGPLVIGATSDVLASQAGLGTGDGLRFALLTPMIVALGTAALFWRARASIERDIVG